MPNADDRGYLLSRANTERELAAEATDPASALIHNQLADEYEARARDVAGEQPTLRVVSEAPSDAKSSASVD
jgi:hypothetical protein